MPVRPERIRDDPPPGLTAGALRAGLASLDGAESTGDTVVRSGGLAEAYLAGAASIPDRPDADPRPALTRADAAAADPASLAIDPALAALLLPGSADAEPTPIYDQLVAEGGQPPKHAEDEPAAGPPPNEPPTGDDHDDA